MKHLSILAVLVATLVLTASGGASADPSTPVNSDSGQWRRWVTRFNSDLDRGDVGDSLLSLRTLASSWPDHLGDLPEKNVLIALRATSGRAQLKRAALLADEALYEANWAPADEDFSDQYYNLALEYLARGEAEKGVAVAKRIRQGRFVLRMAVDRRFDGVSGLDPIAALKAQISDESDRSARAPKSLRHRSYMIEAMDYLGDGASALAAADEAITAEIRSGAFDDASDQFVWILNDRAWALDLLGRHDEALKQMEQASSFPDGRINVSQSLNLGDELYHLDQGRDALKAVSGITKQMISPYGFMEAEEVRACGSAEVDDSAGLRSDLAELRAGQSNDPDAALEGALCGGDLDLAAAVLIHQLDDPASRGVALVQVQTYLSPENPTVWLQKRESQIALLLQRPDVRAAVDQVGVVRSWPIPLPRY